MKKPLISVIIPVYKVENYLNECVQSVVSQTYKKLEIILVDDGSPDLCPQMCDEWAMKDVRIKVIHKKNGGLSDARNAGIEVSTGDYIGFVDSDDFISPEMYQTLYNAFTTAKNVGITSCNINGFKKGKKEAFNKHWSITHTRITNASNFINHVEGGQISHTVWNKLYRADIIKNTRFRKGRNNEDLLFLFDLRTYIKAHRFLLVEIPQYLYFYRKREDSICNNTAIPLAIHKIQNYLDMYNECLDTEKELKTILKKQYVWSVFVFMEKMFTNKDWKKKFFSDYQAKLKSYSLYFLIKNFGLKDGVWLFLTANFPIIRYSYKRYIKHEN